MPPRSFPSGLSTQTLFDALPDPCILLNATSEIAGWNAAFEQERSRCPDLPRLCEAAMPAKPGPSLTVQADDGSTYQAELAPLGADGLRLLRLQRVDPGARQIEFLRRFGASAGHDLQEPVRKMLAFSSLLSKRYAEALDADGVQSLDFISDAAQRMRTLIQACLAYLEVATRPLKHETVALDVLLAEVLEAQSDLIRTAEAHLTAASLPVVSGDPALLKPVLEALIDNALKFRRGPGVQIAIRAKREGHHHRIEVRDDGIGVDPALAGKLFTPFERLHPRETYPGAALGLAQARLILERHGGKIWLEPGAGEGACFVFTLPVSE